MKKANPLPTARSGKKKQSSAISISRRSFRIRVLDSLRVNAASSAFQRKVGKSPITAHNKTAHLTVHLAVSPVYLVLIPAFISLTKFVAHRSGGPAGYGTAFASRKVPRLTVPSRPKSSQVTNGGRAAILKSQLQSGLDRPQLLVE